VELITALIPPSLNTQPQCLITPNGKAPVISFNVRGQTKGERDDTSRSRLLEVLEEGAEPGGVETAEVGFGVTLRLIRSCIRRLSD
jgi:hypothetical protein